MIKTHDKKTRESIPHNNASPKASPNGQVPLRGKTASDEEVRRISRESMKRNHKLGELLAR